MRIGSARHVALGMVLALAQMRCAQFALCACQDCAAASFQRHRAPSLSSAACVSSDALAACKRLRMRPYRAHNAHRINCAHPQRSLHVCAHMRHAGLRAAGLCCAPQRLGYCALEAQLTMQRIGRRHRYHSAYGHSANDDALCQIQRIGDNRHCADNIS